MGPGLLVGGWLLVLGYVLLYVGVKGLQGAPVGFQAALTGRAA